MNPMASLGALQTLAGATAGLNVGSLAGKFHIALSSMFPDTQTPFHDDL